MNGNRITNSTPKLLVIACNWDGWSCIEAAVSAGISYPSSMQIVKVNCLSRVHAGLILQALDAGADGLMLLGCEKGKCHFGTTTDCVKKEYEKAQSVMELLGIDKKRLILVQLPAFSGQKFIASLLKFNEGIGQMLKSSGTEAIDVKFIAK